MPICSVYKISTGEILRIVDCPADEFALQAATGETIYIGTSNDETQYLPSGVLTARPTHAIASAKTLMANGTDSINISSIHNPSNVSFVTPDGANDITSYTEVDGTLTFIVNAVGTYNIFIHSFPYQDVTYSILATSNGVTGAELRNYFLQNKNISFILSHEVPTKHAYTLGKPVPAQYSIEPVVVVAYTPNALAATLKTITYAVKGTYTQTSNTALLYTATPAILRSYVQTAPAILQYTSNITIIYTSYILLKPLPVQQSFQPVTARSYTQVSTSAVLKVTEKPSLVSFDSSPTYIL